MKSSSGEMPCAVVRTLLIDYMEGDLERAVARSLLTHLESCARCESVLKGLQNVAGMLGHLGDYELPPELRFDWNARGGETGSPV